MARLEDHVLGLIQVVVLTEQTESGCILVQGEDGGVGEDPVSTHHLVELCVALDPELCRAVVDRACAWFRKSPSLHDPFFTTTLLRGGRLSAEERKSIQSHVINSQRPSGFIDLYAGFLDGGSIFSTLWAVRILQLTGGAAQSASCIERALDAIRANWRDIHRTSFKGFFLELISGERAAPHTDGTREQVLAEVLAEQQESGLWDSSPLYTSYVLGNLSAIASPGENELGRRIACGFRELFALSTDVHGVPRHIANTAKTHVESVFLQTSIRAALSAALYLRQVHGRPVGRRLASAVMGAFTSAYQQALGLQGALKRMHAQYGSIQARFAHLDKFAAPLLKESRYEKNVFIMMPFRQGHDERYAAIERILRAELKAHRLRAWLASDRTLAPQVWDNVAAFLLACKYGVAVFTRIETENRIETEFNPNVSLELGFCLSRGRQVLILKDKVLERLQTDLVGHLYEEFDLNQVSRQLPRLVRRWAKEVHRLEKESAG